MPTLENEIELINAVGDVLTAENPLDELKARGFTFSPALEQKLTTTRTTKKLSETDQKRWAQEAKTIGPVKFQVRPLAALPAALPEGEYDLMVGVRLQVIFEVLAGLYDTLTWPRLIPPDDAGFLFRLSALRDFSSNVPEGDNITVGALHFTAPPTVSPVNGTENLVVNQPFSLDIDRLSPVSVFGGGVRRTKVSSLDGIVHFGARVVAEVDNNTNELRLAFEGVFGFTEAVAVRIEVDQASPLQPRNAEALTALEAFVQNNFNLVIFANRFGASYSICPVIRLPVGTGVPIRVQRVDIRSLAAGAGVLTVGVLLGPTPEPDEGAGDPERLTNPFTVDVANFHVRLHEELVRKIIQQASESGELQRLAQDENEDLRIDGANVDLRPNEIHIILDGRLVDACGPPGFRFKDLGFRATRIYRYSAFGGEIVVTEEQTVDLDNSDVAVCVILGVFETLIAGAAFGIIGAIADIIAQIVHFVRLSPGAGSDDPIRLSAVFDSNLPVPGTELLPRAETLQSLVEEDTLQANGVLTLSVDNVNTYVYAAFMQRSGFFGLQREPLAQAAVKLIDQDVPPPPGDDVRIPISEDSVVFEGPKRRLTVRTEFEPPVSNQILAQGQTNGEGRVKFFLRPSQIRTSAGTLVTTTITELLDQPESLPQISTTKRPIEEMRPDVFFEVTLPDRRVVDTRLLASGLIINLISKRIGSAENPLMFVVGGGGLVFA